MDNYRCRTVTDFNCLGRNLRITDTDFVIPEPFLSQSIMGSPSPTLIYSKLVTMTVTITDPDFSFENVLNQIGNHFVTQESGKVSKKSRESGKSLEKVRKPTFLRLFFWTLGGALGLEAPGDFFRLFQVFSEVQGIP